jgi:hypothetical protein
MQTRTSLAVAVLSGAAFAQVTTPVGYNTVEGNAVFFHFTGSRLFQSIDASQATTPATFTRFALRRDGASAASASYAARTVDYEVTLGPGNIGQISGDLTQNLAGSTVVHALRNVSMPDWTNPPVTPPAPFDFAVMLDAPYTHGGGPLMWMVRYANSSVTTQTVIDRQFNQHLSASGALLTGSVGCIATGRTVAFGHTTAMRNGSASAGALGMHLQVTTTNAPSSAPVMLSIDTVDSNLTLPFLCTTLRALPTVLLTLGTSSATGTLPVQHLNFGYVPSAIGASLVTQLISIDPGQPAPFLPIALSTGRSTTMPADPAAPSSAAAYAFSTLPATTGTFFFGGCAIAELN